MRITEVDSNSGRTEGSTQAELAWRNGKAESVSSRGSRALVSVVLDNFDFLFPLVGLHLHSVDTKTKVWTNDFVKLEQNHDLNLTFHKHVPYLDYSISFI